VVEAYTLLLELFSDGDVSHTALLNQEELGEVLFGFAKKVNMHAEFVKAHGVDHDGIIRGCAEDIDRFGVPGKGINLEGFIRTLSQRKYSSWLPEKLRNKMNFVYIHHVNENGGPKPMMEDDQLLMQQVLDKAEAIFAEALSTPPHWNAL